MRYLIIAIIIVASLMLCGCDTTKLIPFYKAEPTLPFDNIYISGDNITIIIHGDNCTIIEKPPEVN